MKTQYKIILFKNNLYSLEKACTIENSQSPLCVLSSKTELNMASNRNTNIRKKCGQLWRELKNNSNEMKS